MRLISPNINNSARSAAEKLMKFEKTTLGVAINPWPTPWIDVVKIIR